MLLKTTDSKQPAQNALLKPRCLNRSARCPLANLFSSSHAARGLFKLRLWSLLTLASLLQYDLDDSTWSLKYNLLFDQVLELGLFDYESLVRPDLEFYKGKQNTYGVPLDNRATFTKTDWEFWIGAMDQSEDQGLFNFFVESLWKFADETVSRVPLSDWIDTVKPEMSGFQARPVMGGLYAKMLLVK